MNALNRQPFRVAPEPVTGRFERVRRYAEVLRTEGLDSAQFHRFIALAKAEAKDAPTPELAQLVDDLLGDDRLRGKVIEGEVVVRAKLLEVQQELGFPWALQIDPEDLALLKPPAHHTGVRTFTVLISLFTALFNGGFGVLAIREPISLFFLVGGVHALAVLISTVSFRSRKHLRALGWMWLCGPVFTLLTMALSRNPERSGVLALGLGFALPSMVTAWLALGLSRKAPE